MKRKRDAGKGVDIWHNGKREVAQNTGCCTIQRLGGLQRSFIRRDGGREKKTLNLTLRYWEKPKIGVPKRNGGEEGLERRVRGEKR